MSTQRSSGGWSASATARSTERMSNGFLRSGFVAWSKISPTRVNSPPACGESRTSRSTGSEVGAGRGNALAGRPVGVRVVRQQHVHRPGQVGRPVLRLPVRAHDPVVAADAEVVLGRHAAGVVERLLAGEHHRGVRGHHQDALGVHEHRRLGVPVRLGADVDPGDDDVDLAAVLGELDEPAQHPGDPVHVLGAGVHRDLRAGGHREPLDRRVEARRASSSAASTRRHSGSAIAPSARVGSPISTTRRMPSG